MSKRILQFRPERAGRCDEMDGLDLVAIDLYAPHVLEAACGLPGRDHARFVALGYDVNREPDTDEGCVVVRRRARSDADNVGPISRCADPIEWIESGEDEGAVIDPEHPYRIVSWHANWPMPRRAFEALISHPAFRESLERAEDLAKTPEETIRCLREGFAAIVVDRETRKMWVGYAFDAFCVPEEKMDDLDGDVRMQGGMDGIVGMIPGVGERLGEDVVQEAVLDMLIRLMRAELSAPRPKRPVGRILRLDC